MKSSTVGRGFDVGIEADTISDGQVSKPQTTFHGDKTKKLHHFTFVHYYFHWENSLAFWYNQHENLFVKAEL